MVVVPSVINNSDNWVQMDNGAVNRLDDKNLLAVPHSVPTPSLRPELGCLSMEERIDSRKLNFIYHVTIIRTL